MDRYEALRHYFGHTSFREGQDVIIDALMNGRDAMEFILAGASAVQIGTANFVHPDATIRTVEWIADYCRRHNITDLTTLIGALNR